MLNRELPAGSWECSLADAVAKHRGPENREFNIVLFFRQLALRRWTELATAMDEISARDWDLWKSVPDTDVLGRAHSNDEVARWLGDPQAKNT